MARKSQVKITFHDVILPSQRGAEVEFAHVRTERFGLTFRLREDPQGWFVWCNSTVDTEPERMHDEPFPTATDAHHAGGQIIIESLPRFVKELTRKLHGRESYQRQEVRHGA